MYRKKRGTIKPVAILIAIFSACLILDFLFFVYDTNNKNKETISEISRITDNMISYANKTNDTVMSITSSGKNCDDYLPDIRRIVTITPFIRSTFFGTNDTIKCHSLIGPLDIKDPQPSYVSNKMALITGSLIQTKHPILLVRKKYNSDFYATAIDGMYLQMIMKQLSESGLSIELKVGNVYLSANGELSLTSNNSKNVAFQFINSVKYPYRLSAGLNYTSVFIAYLYIQRYHIYVLICLFVALLFIIIRRSRLHYTLTDDMIQGLEGGEFIAYGQKIINIKTGKASGVEILVRWVHPTHGLIRPDMFIPQAEQSGIIIPITQSLFKQVSSAINQIEGPFSEEFYISFNVTAKHFHNLTLFKDCFQFLRKLKDNKIKLVLELTEREVIPQNETSLRLFRLLKNLGVELAIDDFGTGHSSYSYLHNHYISILKIDRSFIDKISVDAVSGILIDSIIALGHKLSLKMIAEGVETEEQIKYLEEMNVPYAQGYYYNSPQPFKDLIYDLKGI